ncbi:hypothetical protein PtB15_10B439 [Puccinia triticina]|nr:hypothetical protein PtB15_10B439 [Puccinia triticina]
MIAKENELQFLTLSYPSWSNRDIFEDARSIDLSRRIKGLAELATSYQETLTQDIN